MISACEKGKQPDKALGLLEDMQRKGPEPGMIIYSAAISACEKGKQPDKALELLEDMQRNGLVHDIISCSAAISACEMGKRPDKAWYPHNQLQGCNQCMRGGAA